MYPNLLVVTIGRQPAQTTNSGHHNLDSLKQALVEAVDNFPMDVVRTAIDEWPNRLRRCIRTNDGHFE